MGIQQPVKLHRGVIAVLLDSRAQCLHWILTQSDHEHSDSGPWDGQPLLPKAWSLEQHHLGACTKSQGHPDLLNQNLHLNRIPGVRVQGEVCALGTCFPQKEPGEPSDSELTEPMGHITFKEHLRSSRPLVKYKFPFLTATLLTSPTTIY